MIPKSQHRPILIKVKADVSPQEDPFRRRCNLKKKNWEALSILSIWVLLTFCQHLIGMDPSWTLSRNHKYITFPVSGVTEETEELYEDYKLQFDYDPFNCEQHKQAIDSDEIAKTQQKKWQTLIESTYFTQSSRKVCKTITKLSKVYAQPLQQYKVTAIRWLTNS